MNDSPYRNFQYPLNVYAYLLQLETGKVDYLHFGLFEHSGESVALAQQHSTDLVFERLPPAPAALLEVGIGTGATFNRLARAGYRVTGISPEAEQVRLARLRLADISPAPEVELESVGFENFTGRAENFNMVLLQESFQYVSGQQFFRRVHELLVSRGQVLILDEFLSSASTGHCIHLPVLEATRHLAVESGFAIEEELDLSARAAPTVDYLLDCIAAHRHTLLAELPVTAEQLGGLEDALGTYKAAYADGSCRYALLSLRKR